MIKNFCKLQNVIYLVILFSSYLVHLLEKRKKMKLLENHNKIYVHLFTHFCMFFLHLHCQSSECINHSQFLGDTMDYMIRNKNTTNLYNLFSTSKFHIHANIIMPFPILLRLVLSGLYFKENWDGSFQGNELIINGISKM